MENNEKPVKKRRVRASLWDHQPKDKSGTVYDRLVEVLTQPERFAFENEEEMLVEGAEGRYYRITVTRVGMPEVKEWTH